MSHLEYSNAEPGTGSPPSVKIITNEADKAIENGWRRQTPPYDDPPQVGDPYADITDENA